MNRTAFFITLGVLVFAACNRDPQSVHGGTAQLTSRDSPETATATSTATATQRQRASDDIQ